MTTARVAPAARRSHIRLAIRAIFIVFACLTQSLYGQTEKFEVPARKGSYLYYPQPAFEDNSFFLEEAITQEKGVMQYISNFYIDNLRGGELLYSFTHEIPITNLRHQVEYTLYYHLQRATPTGESQSGFGDISAGYRYMASGKKSWAMVVPGFNVIIPTGKSANQNGNGGWGGQLNLAVTKRLSRRLITHVNASYTYVSNADRYTSPVTGAQTLAFEKDLQFENVGASLVWYQSRKFNWMLETVSSFLTEIEADGSIAQRQQTIVNPGLRFAIDHNRVQIVPGFSVPVILSDGSYNRTGLFFYLSFEPQYLPFTKEKSR